MRSAATDQRPTICKVLVLATVTLTASALTASLAAQPDVHFTPTRHAVADAMLQLAGVTPRDVVYDLGSGDGRIPIIAAQKYGARAVGIEIDARLVEIARANARDAGVADRVTFVHGDLFATDFSEATVVALYLTARLNARLEPQLRQLKPGSRIVTHQFGIGRWAPDVTRQIDETTIYLWRLTPEYSSICVVRSCG